MDTHKANDTEHAAEAHALTATPNGPSRAPMLALAGLALAATLIWRTTAQGPIAPILTADRAAVTTTVTADAAAVATPAVIQVAAPAAAPVPSTLTADQRREFEALIKDYLLRNPEVMIEVQANLEAKMEKINAEKMAVSLKENAKELFRSASAPVAGNPQGDITVIEFFDYNCGYCKKALPDLAAVIQGDKNVRVVLKEFPILSKGSEEAAKIALAAKMQGKYWDFHQAMLNLQGQANEASALKVAEKVGIDMGKLKKDMVSAEVKKEIDDTRALATKMGISGTPHFLVGDRVVAGAPENLTEMINNNIAELRKAGGCKVCGG
jgi:protein-disulfide isomerase